MKVALTIQYDGTNFSGFQRQNDRRTVQEEFEKILEVYFRKKLRLHCAGRTDTGVHAVGQVVHFSISEDDMKSRSDRLDQVIYNLNCMLPRDISIIYGREVSEDFHARFSCNGREYLYTIMNSDYRMAFFQANQLWIRYKVDIAAMQKAADNLTGEHDFAAFTKMLYSKMNEKTVRRIDEIRIIQKDCALYFYYNGSGFLHNMIRIITGTLLMVGKGNLTPDDVLNILIGKSRIHIGKTLPAFPLIFLNASYNEYQTPKNLIPFYSILGI